MTTRSLRPVLAAIFPLAAAALVGCSRPEARPAGTTRPPGSIEVKGAGSTFSSPLFERWFAVYHGNHPEMFGTYDAVGSGEGVRRFIGRNIGDGEAVDFGASDSAMSDAQLAQANTDTLMLPVTAGCVVLAYHLPDSVSTPLKLPRSVYTAILMGEISRWNDERIVAANPGVMLPDATIGRAVRVDSSGTTFALTNHLAAVSDRWRRDVPPATSINWPGVVIRGKGNEGVAGLIKNFEGTIGYVGYEFAHRLGLDLAALQNRQGQFVLPSAESCSASLATVDLPENLRAFVTDPPGATSYPIVTFSWALIRKRGGNPDTATALRAFFDWCLQDGQRYASELGYVPLPQSVAAKAVRTLNAASTGG